MMVCWRPSKCQASNVTPSRAGRTTVHTHETARSTQLRCFNRHGRQPDEHSPSCQRAQKKDSKKIGVSTKKSTARIKVAGSAETAL
eukprot:scaffold129689_cov34-Prasinocladus_malaysianus.AAC.1